MSVDPWTLAEEQISASVSESYVPPDLSPAENPQNYIPETPPAPPPPDVPPSPTPAASPLNPNAAGPDAGDTISSGPTYIPLPASIDVIPVDTGGLSPHLNPNILGPDEGGTISSGPTFQQFPDEDTQPTSPDHPDEPERFPEPPAEDFERSDYLQDFTVDYLDSLSNIPLRTDVPPANKPGVTGKVTSGIWEIENIIGRAYVHDDRATGGHAPNSDHYIGAAVDVDPLRSIWNQFYPIRKYLRSLLGPWGLYEYGVRYYSFAEQSNHQNHIHISYYGTNFEIDKLLGVFPGTANPIAGSTIVPVTVPKQPTGPANAWKKLLRTFSYELPRVGQHASTVGNRLKGELK